MMIRVDGLHLHGAYKTLRVRIGGNADPVVVCLGPEVQSRNGRGTGRQENECGLVHQQQSERQSGRHAQAKRGHRDDDTESLECAKVAAESVLGVLGEDERE